MKINIDRADHRYISKVRKLSTKSISVFTQYIRQILHISTILQQNKISRVNASTLPSFIYKYANNTPESPGKNRYNNLALYFSPLYLYSDLVDDNNNLYAKTKFE